MKLEDKGLIEINLFWNVQFIYELVLATMELDSFEIEYDIENSLRSFKVTNIPDVESFINRTAYFEEVDTRKTLYRDITSRNITRSINQYLTHWFYPYKGKFHPQMIRALLNCMQVAEGDTILDPFIGSGTTALEAQFLGINCIGTDVSEVCYLISKAKTNSLSVLSEIHEYQQEINNELNSRPYRSEKENIKTISRIIDEIEIEEVREFFKVAELISHSDKSRRRKKDFRSSFENNIEKMIISVENYSELKSEKKLTLGKTEYYLEDARELHFSDNSIDGVITSPPYSIALDYVENDKHSLSVLGYNINEIRDDFIGVRGKGKAKIDLYNKDMERAYFEIDRVLKPGKYCVIVIGNATVNKQETKSVEMTIDSFKKMGYTLEKNIDKIIFGLYNIMQKENILIFRKE